MKQTEANELVVKSPIAFDSYMTYKSNIDRKRTTRRAHIVNDGRILPGNQRTDKVIDVGVCFVQNCSAVGFSITTAGRPSQKCSPVWTVMFRGQTQSVAMLCCVLVF